MRLDTATALRTSMVAIVHNVCEFKFCYHDYHFIIQYNHILMYVFKYLAVCAQGCGSHGGICITNPPPNGGQRTKCYCSDAQWGGPTCSDRTLLSTIPFSLFYSSSPLLFFVPLP